MDSAAYVNDILSCYRKLKPLILVCHPDDVDRLESEVETMEGEHPGWRGAKVVSNTLVEPGKMYVVDEGALIA